MFRLAQGGLVILPAIEHADDREDPSADLHPERDRGALAIVRHPEAGQCVFRSNPPPIPLSNWSPVMLPNRPPGMLSNRPVLGFWPEAEATRRADTGQEETVVATAAKRGHLVHEARGWRGSVQVTP